VKTINVPDRPYHFSWDLTTACNLHCSFCYSAAGPADPAEGSELVELILDNIEEVRPLHIGIGGGEPLLSPFIGYVLESIPRRMRHETPIVTIDTMNVAQRPDVVDLVRGINEELGAPFMQFYVSIHGIHDVHDRIVGRKGHFREQIRGIRLLQDRGINFSIGIVPTRRNLDQLDDLLALALEIKAGLLNISQFVPIGRGRRVEDDNLDRNEFRRLLSWIAERNAQLGSRYIVTHEHWMSVTDDDLLHSDLFVGCSAGIYYFGVRSNGDVVPCQLNSLVLGNVRTTRLIDIWTNHPTLQAWRRRQVQGRCRSCPFLMKCGGCRCNAVSYAGDFFAADPLCPFSDQELAEAYRRGRQATARRLARTVVGEPSAVAEDATVSRVVRLATQQGGALILRNEFRNAFVRLTDDARLIYELVPQTGDLRVADLRKAFRTKTGREMLSADLHALFQADVVRCSSSR
jgi:radical SAM protein with 4Fe4S-binding SPASM domain